MLLAARGTKTITYQIYTHTHTHMEFVVPRAFMLPSAGQLSLLSLPPLPPLPSTTTSTLLCLLCSCTFAHSHTHTHTFTQSFADYIRYAATLLCCLAELTNLWPLYFALPFVIVTLYMCCSSASIVTQPLLLRFKVVVSWDRTTSVCGAVGMLLVGSPRRFVAGCRLPCLPYCHIGVLVF